MTEDRARDVTERQKLLQVVSRGKIQWESAMDSLADLVLLVDSRFRILRCNAALARHVGVPLQSLIGRQVDECLWPRAGVALSKLSARDSEVQASERCFHVTRTLLALEGGTTGWAFVIRDVTEPKRLGRLLSAEQEKLAVTLASIADGVITTDTGGRLTLMNAAAESITGWRLTDGVGRPVGEVYEVGPGRAPARALLIPGPAQEAGRPQAVERTLRRRDGSEAIVSEIVSAIHDPSGQTVGTAVVFRDVTGLRRLESIAASVDMMNNLGHVLASVRHEIGNPLNALKTALVVLRESQGRFSPEKTEEYLIRCLDDVARMQKLLEKLRTYNMFESVVVDRVDVIDVVHRCAERLRVDFLQKNILFETSFPTPTHVAVLADREALDQVLLGVVANAVEAVAQTPFPAVGLTVDLEPDIVSLRVTDNGPGVPPEEQERVFLPLYTTKPGGTGLGLPIARSLLARMGGSIVLRGGRSGGTEVVITLHTTADQPLV